MAPNAINAISDKKVYHETACQIAVCSLWSTGHALGQNSHPQGFVPYNHSKHLSPFSKFYMKVNRLDLLPSSTLTLLRANL